MDDTGNSHLLPYQLTSSAPAMVLPDTAAFQNERGSLATHHLEGRLDQLKREYEALVTLAHETNFVYNVRYNFVPKVGRTYHLYGDSSDPGKCFLSMIAPEEWQRPDYIASFRFTVDNTWEKMND